MVLGLLVQRLALIQVQGVLRFVGNKGRQIIAEVHPSMTASGRLSRRSRTNISTRVTTDLAVTQTIVHSGEPMAIAAYDVQALVGLARKAGGLIVMSFAVGDTVIDGELFPQTARRAYGPCPHRTYCARFVWSVNAPLSRTPSTRFVCSWISP